MIVLVLFVGVSASQTKTGQEGSEEVEDETNDDKGCSSTKITCTSGSSASSSFRHAKRQRCWSSSRDTLHEQAFPPAICQHPVRSGGGGHHQDHRDEAAGEGYHLEWPGGDVHVMPGQVLLPRGHSGHWVGVRSGHWCSHHTTLSHQAQQGQLDREQA